MDEILEVENVSHFYENKKSDKKVDILDNVSFTLKRGDVVSIIGKSGSGKSTFLHISSSLLKPKNGIVRICKKDVYSLNARQLSDIRNQKIGFVFQSFNLIEELTCYENIILPIEIRNKDKKKYKEKLRPFISKLGVSEILKNKPSEISGGERARIAILRALSVEPEIVFLDEPTGALDNENAHKIEDLIIDLSSLLGISFMYVTHDREFARRAKKQYEIKDKMLINIC